MLRKLGREAAAKRATSLRTWHPEGMRRDIDVGACSLEDEDLAARAARWRSEIGPAVIERRRVQRGLLTRLRADLETEQSLRELIRLEAECCPHLDFDVARVGSELHLTVRFRAAS